MRIEGYSISKYASSKQQYRYHFKIRQNSFPTNKTSKHLKVIRGQELFLRWQGAQSDQKTIQYQVYQCIKSRTRYNQFLSMDNTEAIGIFFEEKHTQTIHQQNCKEEPLPESVPYLQRGDSSKYLEQFLAKEQAPPLPVSPSEPSKKEENPSHSLDEDFSLSSPGRFNPSAFHNFQKHLTVSLKHSIEIKIDESTAEEYQKVAAKMWKAFRQSSISTKKVLHYLLGEHNQHSITEAGLKAFGLQRIYEEAGDRVAAQARKYLANQTLRQIGEGKLKEYIDNKKLKDKSQFRRYVKIFEEELIEGFLRKRLPKEKVNELLRC